MAYNFFVQWNAYKKLVDFNYMDHAGLFTQLSNTITQSFRDPVSVLDLGCGDCAPLEKWLRHLDIAHYTGVDEADNALEMAKTRLASLGIEHALIEGELTDILPALERQYDVIIMGFCLHHFDSADRKRDLLADCRKLLRQGGFMAIIDVVSQEGESRDDFLGRCDSRIRAEYTELDEEELDIILTHIWRADFPESFSTYRSIGEQAGFAAVEQTMLDATGMHGLISLHTSALS